MAALHAVSFPAERSWSAGEIAALAHEGLVLTEPEGFLLGRIAADEAEILTLAVAPEARRRGVGRRLLARFEAAARTQGAASAFLEVAADNHAARALYLSAGWHEAGVRRGYYLRHGARHDALVLARSLHAIGP